MATVKVGQMVKAGPADHSERRRPYREAFSAALADRLKATGMSQNELARRLGRLAGQSTISEWLAGQTEPAFADIIFEVERILGCRPGELSTFLGYEPTAVTDVDALRIGRMVIAEMDKLPPRKGRKP
ncbi:MAG: helix-turn-helix domain-containing protein [Candidatus Rokuibacteriota bacterium]